MSQMTTQQNLRHQELIDEAMDSEEPVTSVSDHTTHRIFRAILEVDGVCWMATIDTIDDREEFDSTPSVSYQKCHPDSTASILRSWSSLATGSLPGPKDLDKWEILHTVFDAVLDLYNEEVSDNE